MLRRRETKPGAELDVCDVGGVALEGVAWGVFHHRGVVMQPHFAVVARGDQELAVGAAVAA